MPLSFRSKEKDERIRKKHPRPSRAYDVPIPPALRPKVTKEIERRRKEREQQELERPTSVMGYHVPSLLRPPIGAVKVIAAGAIPFAKTAGKAVGHDVKWLAEHPQDWPSRQTAKDYYELLKWTVADEKGDKRKQPASPSAVMGLLSQLVRGMGRGFETAIPSALPKGMDDPLSGQPASEDRKEASKRWHDNWALAALDVVPFLAAPARVGSATALGMRIAAQNDIALARALKMGVKESYRPGAAARKGLAGGVPERILRSPSGEARGRPWSRTPLMREFQRRYDSLYETRPGLADKRVGRARERLDNEERRQIRLEADELTDPIKQLVYGRMGRVAGAFGLKKTMTPRERRVATALIYRLQMSRHLPHTDALKAVQSDLEEIFRSGKMEVTQESGRIKQMPLSQEEKHNLALQIQDLDLARKDLHEGRIKQGDMDAGLEALSEIAERTQAMGLDILERKLHLDPDALEEIRSIWKRRSELLPRRLASRGHLDWRPVADSEERAAWSEILTRQLGDERARTLVALTDAIARKVRPQDPASFWTERIGKPTRESAEAFVERAGEDALFQMERPERPWVTGATVEGAEGSANYFYSPLQRWLENSWPAEAKAMKVSTLEARVKESIPEEEFYNAGLDLFFDKYSASERVSKEAFMEHLSSPLNAYNLEEHHFINQGTGGHERFEQGTFEQGDTRYDSYMNGAVVSRDPAAPGEYHEIVMRLPGRPRDPSEEGRNYGFQSKGYQHWNLENVVVHVRFHIFDEGGVRKMLVEEIQSDWSSEARDKPFRPLTIEEIREAYLLQEELDSMQRARTNGAREIEQISDRMNLLQEEERGLLRQLGEPISKAEAERLNGELEDLRERGRAAEDERYRLLDEDLDLAHKLRELMDERAKHTEEGVIRSPLGDQYYRAGLRRMMREAVEQNVDEVIFQDPATQMIRGELGNDHGMLERLSRLNLAHGPEPVREWVRRHEEALEPRVAAITDKLRQEGERLGRMLTEEEIHARLNVTERRDYARWKEARVWRQLYATTFPNFLKKEYKLNDPEWRADAYQGRFSSEDWDPNDYSASEGGRFSKEGPMAGLVLQVNDLMREKVMGAQRLYQRQPDWKGLPRGATELLQGRNLLHIFETGNVDTWWHELGHTALFDLGGDDLRTIEQHYGGGRTLDQWLDTNHENFARDWEAYGRRGIAPTPELQSVFAKLSAWMREIWAETKNRLPEEAVPEEMIAVFDRMLADLPDHGEELDTFGYFPHRDLFDSAQQNYRGGVRPPASGQTIGVPRLTQQAIARGKNELLLYQGGRLNPDPAGLVDVYLRRLQFQETLNARDHLWEIGHSLAESQPPPGAWLIRNPDRPPERITPRVSAAVRGQKLKRELEPDLESNLSITPEDFREEIIAKASDKPPWASDLEDVRWVPGEYVNARFGEVFESRPRGGIWSFMGMMNSLARTTGIYGRPIAYAAGNIPFNITALLATMPLANARSAQQMIRLRKRDPALYRAISSESGQAKAEAGLPGISYTRPVNRMQRAEQQVTATQRGIADVLSSFSDDPYRVVAFLSNARKRGYSTDEELRALIDADGGDLSDVRQLTREQMLDFDALNPMQRRAASQMLYLWPFMYAATKWPLMYAREYPGRAGLVAQGAEQEPDRLSPLEVANFWKSKGVDLSSVNPFGPGGEMAADLDKLLADPTTLDLTVLKERLNPTIDMLIEGATGGKKHMLQNYIRGMIPGAAEAAAFLDEEYRGSKMYADRDSPWPYLRTRHLRFLAPRELNEQRMKEAITQAKRDELGAMTIDRQRDEDKKKINAYAQKMGGIDYTDEVKKSFNAWWDYQEAVDQKKDSTGQRKLSPTQQVEILDVVVREHFPEMADELYPLDKVRSAAEKNEKAVDEYVVWLRGIVNEGRSMLFDDYRSYAAP